MYDVSVQEYAAITVGNCGANSEEGAKMIVRNQAVMQALISCMSNAHDVRMQETAVVALKNCAASSQEAALGISQSDQTMSLLKSFVLQTTHARLRDVAVGAINSISRSPAAVPKLKTTGVHSAMLQEMLSVEDSRPSGGTSDLRTLTAACAVINIEASQPELHLLQPWLKSAAGKRAIHNMVRCLGFALRGEQWKCVSFSPHSVICPLYNLTRCFALDDLSIDGVKVVQYILQLKDRHNGNILVDSAGRMVHIDFHFMLGWAPGGITFEKAGFKLTKDIVDVWGGRGSPLWDEFVELFCLGLLAVQTHHELIMRDVEVIAASGARFPFLKTNVEVGGVEFKTLSKSKKRILQLLRRRFKLYKSPQKLRSYALTMIDDAYDNFWTRTYAKFQLLTNGIPP